MPNTLSPIALFVYNRPMHTAETIYALEKNHLASDSHLVVFSDGPKNSTDEKLVNSVRNLFTDELCFKSVTIRKEKFNKGLANSVIDGVTKVIEEHGTVIVLEDDIVTSPHFLDYMNSALKAYSDNNEIFSISGFNYPPTKLKIPENYLHDYFFSYRSSSWGWATWKDRWLEIDWSVSDYAEFIHSTKAIDAFNKGGEDLSVMLEAQMRKEIDSWAIRWNYAQYKKGSLTLYPVNSYVNNIGMDGSGVHCGTTDSFHNDLILAKESYHNLPDQIFLDKNITAAFRDVYKLGFVYKCKKLAKKILPNSVVKILKKLI